jgi:hypothetical protein
MVEGTGVVKSPWNGALIAAGAMAIISVFAVAKQWDLNSWLWAAAVCAVGGAVSSLAQARRNRRLDAATRQARKTGHQADADNSR